MRARVVPSRTGGLLDHQGVLPQSFAAVYPGTNGSKINSMACLSRWRDRAAHGLADGLGGKGGRSKTVERQGFLLRHPAAAKADASDGTMNFHACGVRNRTYWHLFAAQGSRSQVPGRVDISQGFCGHRWGPVPLL